MTCAWTLCLVGFVALLISASLTLAKVVFSAVAAARDDSRESAHYVKAIWHVVETPPFFEVVSLGRIVANSTASVSVFFALGYWLPATPWFWLNACIRVFLLWHVIYLSAIFLPSLLGNLRPHTLAFPVYLVFRFVSLLFWLPARAQHFIYFGILGKLGYDSRLKFLTDDQRDMLETDTSEAEEEGALEEDERQMILNIFDFVETPVREIMTPRVDMRALEVGTDLAEVVSFLNTERHSRVPVYRESVDNIVGMLHNRDFLHWITEHPSERLDLAKIIKPAIFVPYHKKIDDLLRDFRRSGNQLAIVVDEYGG
ncbi:MAG TPA: CBS domain-containing protein, partial [Fibrobacteraceae bacterium]|nr:CBS domain-containing protein [Fibrobacteraceae bacterium]